jgi:peptide deformylase
VNLALVSEDNPVLKTVSEPWDFENPIMETQLFQYEMHRLMKEEGGIGLAANQVGLAVSVLVMNIDGEAKTCFNPKILEASVDETITLEEGCLSFPGMYFKVKRPARIKVQYQDVNAEYVTEELDGLWSRCFQHEIDHLNGICFVDKVSKLVLNMAKRRRVKYGRK